MSCVLAIVTPMANERETAVEFLRSVLAVTASLQRTDVFVVFDRISTDGTIDVVREFAREEPRVHVIWAPENRSITDAYLRGYREALASGAEWILEIDAGFSHAPSDIARFVDVMDDGWDCLFGSRFCDGGRMVGGKWSRYFVSKGGTILTNTLIGTRLRDMTSGFQMFRSSALAAILDSGLKSRGPFFQTEMKIYARNLRIREVPISYAAPPKGVREGSIADALGVLLGLFMDRVRGKLAFAEA
jgi:dolichol-phosphate mannosyltransferase